jgi:hypothetical protein
LILFLFEITIIIVYILKENIVIKSYQPSASTISSSTRDSLFNSSIVSSFSILSSSLDSWHSSETEGDQLNHPFIQSILFCRVCLPQENKKSRKRRLYGR